MSPRSSFLRAALNSPSDRLTIRLESTGQAIATHVETAFDSTARRRGLLGRDMIEDNFALIIAPCNAVHTFFMRFAIDTVFVDRGGHVIKARAAVPPWRIGFGLGAYATIELAAGTIARFNISTADRLCVTPS